MAQTYSKLRQQAENAFQKTQAVIPVDDQLSKNDTDADRLRAKTARLRNARLERNGVDSGQPSSQ
jgi:hypothetical protein